MQITNQYRYNRCIELAAKLDQIAHMIDDMEEIEEELLVEDEYNKYIVQTSSVIVELADIMRHKSKWYTKDDEFEYVGQIKGDKPMVIPMDKEIYFRVNVSTR